MLGLVVLNCELWNHGSVGVVARRKQSPARARRRIRAVGYLPTAYLVGRQKVPNPPSLHLFQARAAPKRRRLEVVFLERFVIVGGLPLAWLASASSHGSYSLVPGLRI